MYGKRVPLRRPERAVGEAGAQLVMAVAEQALDDVPRMLADQRARQVIDRRGLRQLERGVLHLARSERRMLDRQIHLAVAQLRVMLDPVLGALHRQAPARRPSGSVPSPRTCRASASRPRCRSSSSSWCSRRPVTVANFAAAAQAGAPITSHQPLPFLVGVTDDDAPVVVAAGIGAIGVVRRDGRARGSCSASGVPGQWARFPGGKPGRREPRPLTVKSSSAGPLSGTLATICDRSMCWPWPVMLR